MTPALPFLFSLLLLFLPSFAAIPDSSSAQFDRQEAQQAPLVAADGQNATADGAGQNGGGGFVPLLRRGRLVNAKFNGPNGPVQATVEFGENGKKKEEAQKGVRAVFSGKDGTGQFIRKRFRASLAGGEAAKQKKKKEEAAADGVLELGIGGKKEEKVIRDGDGDGTVIGQENREARKRAELRERPEAVVEEVTKKVEEGGGDGHWEEVIGRAKEGTETEDEGKKKKEGKKEVEEEKKEAEGKKEEEGKNELKDTNSIRDGDGDGTKRKQSEDENEARKSEEWNTWSFLPSLFGVGETKTEGQKGVKGEQKEEAGEVEKEEAKNGNGSRVKVEPSGGSVQLAPVVQSAVAPSNGACEDLAENCVENRAFCGISPYEKLMGDNCAKTCGQCQQGGGDGKEEGESAKGRDEETEEKKEERLDRKEGAKVAEEEEEEHKEEAEAGTNRAEVANCKDVSARCAQWAQRGFCTSRFFHRDLKVRFCAKSCGFCGAKGRERTTK